jgi:metallo-beta-lactamase family protein
MSRDVLTLKRKYGMEVSPIYTNNDVQNSLQYFEQFDMHELIELNKDISFRFCPSGHIINSAQLELWLTENNRTVKILYTSDLGNISIDKYYISKFEPVDKANLVIAETTYANELRSVGKKDRDKDLEKIKTVIDTVCCDNHSKVLVPVFSLDRCQNILTHLYDIYGHDTNFKIPILIDSPLAIKLSRLYEQLLDGEQLQKYKEVISWKNIKWIEEYEESKRWQHSKEPLCVLSSSGFMQAGRSRQWAKTLLPDSLAHILFVGYSSDNSLAGKIKRGKHQKTISIDKEVIPNRCGITDLKSFSSHIQHNDMLNYYSNINSEKVALVHGDFKEKVEFAKALQDECAKKNKTTKIICVNKTTELLI